MIGILELRRVFVVAARIRRLTGLKSIRMPGNELTAIVSEWLMIRHYHSFRACEVIKGVEGWFCKRFERFELRLFGGR
jgi:hypothetical protein